MAAKVQLIGGIFQDSEGNALNLGYLKFQLNQDENISGVGQIASGIEVKINLDAFGSVDTGTPQYIWGNDQMLPANSYYRVRGYTASGQLAWGPNNQQVLGSGGTFDVGTWVPNAVFSWTPPTQPLVLKTNGVANGSQVLENIIAGTGMTITDDGVGNVTYAASGSGGGVGVGGAIHNVHGYYANRTTAPNVAAGFAWSDGDGATEAKSSPTATEPILDNISTQAFGGGDDVYLADTGTPAQSSTLGCLLSTGGRVKTPSAANSRYWIGLAAGGTALYPTKLNTNTPTIGVVAFRASTSAPDTNWMCVCTNGTTQTTVNSGVAIDRTTSHIFQIFTASSGATAKFYIDGVLVATISTNLPATSVPLNTTVFLDNVGTASVVTVGVGFLYYETI